MLCHNFLIGNVRTYVLRTYYNVTSQLSDWKRVRTRVNCEITVRTRTYSDSESWKRAHMCTGTDNHVCFLKINGSQLREGGTTYTCTYVRTRVRTRVRTIMLCHNFLIGKVHVYHGTYVQVYVPWYHGTSEYHGPYRFWYVHEYVLPW
jgi:hypothetical protein